MAKNRKTNEKAAVIMAKSMQFIKHNIYYILMGICIIALVTVITIAALNKAKQEEVPLSEMEQVDPNLSLEEKDNKDKQNEDKKENKNEQENNNNKDVNQVSAEKFYIISPIESLEIIQTFSNTELVYNKTQNHWATHEGVDFKAKAGSEVKSVYDGEVVTIQESSFYGTTVVIKHKDGYESVYKLLKDVKVKKGDIIKKNTVIGVVSDEALAEISDGPHLHFELLKDGKNVDPMEFINSGNK